MKNVRPSWQPLKDNGVTCHVTDVAEPHLDSRFVFPPKSNKSVEEAIARTNRGGTQSGMGDSTGTSPSKSKVVCCVGDVHGYITKLRSLWSNLEAQIGTNAFSTAVVIFLGDYCDRGPQTKEVLDFLISLPSLYPNQTHVFLCGNHDFAFAAFVGALPPPPDGSDFSATWDEFEVNQEREGWFKGEGYERMHVQGRRWGGSIQERWNAKKGMEYKGSIYDARPTFQSYGVPHGSPDLSRAVPQEHKNFLASLVWIHEEEDVYIDSPQGRLCCKLIAVHAGLDKFICIDEQLKFLKARDTSLPKVAPLSGRQNVWDIPKELSAKPIIVVSGHHGALHVDGLRLIIDESGGIEDNPLASIVLPSKMLVRDIDNVSLAL